MIPYLVRTLGPENFGRIAFAQAFIAYFIVITDYGFNLTATRNVALVRNDPDKLSLLFSAVMIIKLFLLTLGFCILFAIVSIVPRFENDWLLYVLAYIAVAGNVLFPNWLFQGLERMQIITVLSLLAQLIVLTSIFTLVRHPNDYHLAVAIQASGMLITGLMSLVLIPHLIKLRLCWPGVPELKHIMIDGWHVFLSISAINLYTSSNIFLLGLLVSSTAVGYFAAADKIVRSVGSVLGPIFQSVYPHIASLKYASDKAALVFIKKLLLIQGGITLVLSLLLFSLAEPITYLLMGTRFEQSIQLVKFMAVLPFLTGLSNVFGIQIMLNFDMKQAESRILITAGFINIAYIIPLVYWLGIRGASISVLLTEIIVILLMVRALIKKGLMQKIIWEYGCF